ncbi:Lin0512 family protein [Virgibacillus sp.]
MEHSLPEQKLENMKVNVRLAVPLDRNLLDTEKVKAVVPYGIYVHILDTK